MKKISTFTTYVSQSSKIFFVKKAEAACLLDIYMKYMLIGDFNAGESETCLPQFLFEMNAKNIVKEPTCFKNLSNPSCIDLVITNSSSNFNF